MRPRKWPASSKMWRRRMSLRCSGVNVPEVSHVGSWLCQTSVCPRTAWWLARAKRTSASPWLKSVTPCWGSTDSHFMTFSGVTMLNSRAIAALYAGSLASAAMSTAVPMSGRRARSRSPRWCPLPAGAADAAASIPSTTTRALTHAPTRRCDPLVDMRSPLLCVNGSGLFGHRPHVRGEQLAQPLAPDALLQPEGVRELGELVVAHAAQALGVLAEHRLGEE